MESDLILRAISAIGLLMMLLLAWLLSENRALPKARLLLWGVGLQVLLGLLILRTPFGAPFFDTVRAGFELITAASNEGAKFLFGNLTQFFLLDSALVPGPEGMQRVDSFAISAVVAFRVLPTIIFVASLAAVLQHIGVVQLLVGGIAKVMRYTLRTSGAETFGAALLIFLGIEGISAEPGHLLAASLMSAPAAIVIAKLMVPERETPATAGGLSIKLPRESHNIFDAASRGASLGLQMALSVGAMLIVFIGFIYLADLAALSVTGYTLNAMLGWFFRPFAFLLGVPWADIPKVGELLATKTIFNEFIAYQQMQPLIEGQVISPRAITISTYALCGFANPGSLGIMIGALAAMIPERRSEVAQMAFRALIAGTLAAFTTACVAGILVEA
ncbi:MAG: hypothetical protein GC168_13805 [Candidatus Hydrogenedens sp.]|nr:hypothetical protein [Candidatus Hydrogenedens sp.]